MKHSVSDKTLSIYPEIPGGDGKPPYVGQVSYLPNNFRIGSKYIRKPDRIEGFGEKTIWKHCDAQRAAAWHDDKGGSQKGSNLLMKFTISGKNFLHCGDLGHILDKGTLNKLGQIDVLFIPVGGNYTIDALEAKTIVDALSPIIVFPMHYKTDVLEFPIAAKESYLNLINDLVEVTSNEIELNESDFTNSKTIILNYE